MRKQTWTVQNLSKGRGLVRLPLILVLKLATGFAIHTISEAHAEAVHAYDMCLA